MKLLTLFVVFGLIISSAILGVVFTIEHLSNEQKVTETAEEHLLWVTKYNLERIDNYLNEMQKDIELLLEMNYLQKAFDVNLLGRVEGSKKGIERVVKNKAEKINKYLINNPKMTVEDLQKSDEFKTLFDMPIGEGGYFMLIDSNSLIGYYHPEERRINYDYHNYQTDFPAFWEIISRIEDNHESKGTYSRPELGGDIRDKYAHAISIDTPTADFRNLSLIATVYLSEYLNINIEKNIQETIANFNSDNYYKQIIFTDLNGGILASSENIDISDNLLFQLQDRILNNSIFQLIEIFDIDSRSLRTFFAVPYFDSGLTDDSKKLTGFGFFETSSGALNEVMFSGEYSGILASIYMVNENGIIVGSSNKSMSANSTLNIKLIDACDESKEDYYQGPSFYMPKAKIYTNSFGDKYFGLSQYITDSKRCIISEISKDRIKSIHNNSKFYWLTLIVFLTLWIIGIIFILLVSRMYDFKKRGNKK